MKLPVLPRTRAGRWRLALLILLPFCLPLPLFYFTAMPGSSFEGELEPLSAEQVEARERLQRHVEVLANKIVARDTNHPETLAQAAQYIRGVWEQQGYKVLEQEYVARGETVRNLEVELPGSDPSAGIVLVGAHYDTAYGWPGADDNASGVAAVLELSRAFANAARSHRTLRFVAFVNEEPPDFQTETMGSLVYARRSAERGEDIACMLSLETVAYFKHEPGTQQYPWPLEHFYGDTGDFIAFVGDVSSRDLVRQCVASFREHDRFPSDGLAAPDSIPGVGWSDHWSFWQHGYPAVMVTDTAPFRNPNYHSDQDLPETLDFESMTRVVFGLESVLRELTSGGELVRSS